jgi:hypothetical protein
MSKHEKEQSISEEPHLRKDQFAADPSEEIAFRTLAGKTQSTRFAHGAGSAISLKRNMPGG